jgi:tetratricopeptide (TPR) repeat protein
MARIARRPVTFRFSGAKIAFLIVMIALCANCAGVKPKSAPPPPPPAAATAPAFEPMFHEPHQGAGGNPAKLGKVYVGNGQLDKGIAELNKAIAANPGDFYSLNFRAEAWFRKGDVAKAMADTNAALAVRPDFADAYNLRGYMYLTGKQYDNAVADFDKALTYNYRHEAAFNHRGLAEIAKGEYEKAIADFTQAISIDGNYIEAWFNKGEACEKAGRIPEAVEAYKTVARLSPAKPTKWSQAAAERIKALGGQ